MSSGKWSVNYCAVAENLKNSTKAFENASLVGILYGIADLKQITDVIFTPIPPDSESLDAYASRILVFYPPEVEVLGLARLSDTDPPNLSSAEKVSLKFGADDFKQLRIITCANPITVNSPGLLSKDFDTCNIKVCGSIPVRNDSEIPLFVLKSQSTNDGTLLAGDFETLVKEGSSILLLEPSDDSLTIINKLSDTQISNDTTSSIKLSLDLLLFVSTKLSNPAFETIWRQLVQRALSQARFILSHESENVKKLVARTFAPPGRPMAIQLLLPADDNHFSDKHRQEAQKMLNLSDSIPLFHECQSLSALLTPNHPHFFNPHEYIKFTPTNGGICAVVRGCYEYHHYMQDNINDNGWGCAYRSFQTVWSWFYHQNFTRKPVPGHRDIQQCLVDIGDKKPNFVGSREWIGSLELSYCLENMLGISSRILSAKSSDVLAEHARAIIFHFENYGAPIMIGGGQYAYTILGIDYDVRLGKCQFLVLDPHYTGNENIQQILKNGWCAWKPMSFWTKKVFFNLLLPINPSITTEKN